MLTLRFFYGQVLTNPCSKSYSSPTETIPVSSSTDWQAAFGFGSSKQQEDDLGFDPFDVTRKALADLIEKELSVQDQPSLSPTSLQNPSPHTTAAKGPGSGFLHPAAPANANSLSSTFPVMPQRFPQFQQHRAVYNSFSFPGQAARYPWMAFPRNSIMHLNHTANPTSNSNFLDLNLQPQHSTGLGGIPISGRWIRTAVNVILFHAFSLELWVRTGKRNSQLQVVELYLLTVILGLWREGEHHFKYALSMCFFFKVDV